MTPEERIVKAKITLLIHEPWFGQLACYLNLIEVKKNDKSMEFMRTAAVDARGNFYFCPEYINKLSDAEVVGLVCHEILHLAFQHPFRLQERNPLVWNLAADIKVNSDVPTHSEASLCLPKAGIKVDNGIYQYGKIRVEDVPEKTTEQIYNELFKQLPQISVTFTAGGGMNIDMSGLPQDVKDMINKLVKDLIQKTGKDKLSKSEQDQLERQWQERINSACKSQGDIPAGLKRELDALENPDLPWQTIIRQRFSRIRVLRTWKRPNKRRLPFYFPGKKKNRFVKAVIAIDTSGSMSQHDLVKAVSETWGIANAFPEFQLYIVWCDAEVWGKPIEVKRYNKSKIKHLVPQGGGGTDFRPVFDMIKEKFANKIDCLVFFTDGYGTFPDKKPMFQTYWVSNERNIDWPFGRLIKMNY